MTPAANLKQPSLIQRANMVEGEKGFLQAIL